MTAITSCRRARRAALLRADDRLPFEGGLALDEHLAGCDACRAYAELVEDVEETLARWPEPPAERLDVDAAVSAVRRRIGAESRNADGVDPSAAPRRSFAFLVFAKPARVAAVAAVTIVVAAAAWFAWSSRTASTDPVEPRVASKDRDAFDGSADAVASGITNDGASEPGDDVAARTERVAPADADTAAGASLPEPEPIDRDRLAAARARLAAVLAANADALPVGATRDEARDFASAVDDALAADGDWPWRRFAERELAAPDTGLARAAARYLGATGDGLSAAALAQASKAHDTAPAVMLALRDLERLDAPECAAALADPARADAVLAALAGADDATAVRVIARAVDRAFDARVIADRSSRAKDANASPAEIPSHTDLAAHADRLIDALLDRGPASLDAAIAACARGVLSREALHDRAGDRAWFAASIASAAASASADERGALAWWLDARTNGASAVPALVARAERGTARGAALEALVATRSADAFAAIVALHDAGLVDFDAADRALHAIAEARPDAVATIAPLATTDRATAAWILALDTSAAVPALRALVADEGAAPDVRRDAILALGRLGGADEAEWLAPRVRAFSPRDRQLAAAALIAVHRLDGDAAAERALEGAPDRLRNTSLQILRRADRLDREPPVHRLSRALAPWLEATDSTNGKASS